MKFEIILIVYLLLSPALGRAQNVRFDDWFAARVETALERARVGENGKGASRQRETPSGDGRSTSLVDQSSASDFVSAAVNLIPAGGVANSGSGAVTASAYSLLAGLRAKALSDPEFYASHSGARQIFFTLGSAASNLEQDNTERLGLVVGVKYTLLNGRDLYSRSGRKLIDGVQKALTKRVAASTRLKDQVQQILFAACHGDGMTFADFLLKYYSAMDELSAPPEVLRRIDALIVESSAAFEDYDSALRAAYDKVRNGKQLALSYQSITRADNGYNDHRAEVIYDHGLGHAMTWTSNAGVEIKDRKQAGLFRGRRAATEFKAQLTRENESPFGRAPLTLSFGAEAKWLDGVPAQYTAQARLTVPLASGIEFPIVFRYANRRDLLDQTAQEARFGLVVDLGRLAAAR
jgi:hypothetical protein